MDRERRFVAENPLAFGPKPDGHEVFTIRRRKMNEPKDSARRSFDAPLSVGNEIVARVERWARSAVDTRARLIVQLDPPDSSDAWRLAVFAPNPRGAPAPIEQAIVMAGSDRRYLEDEMIRLERMVPPLLRPGGTRRGQVVLSADEAWDMMATTGPRLRDAGYDVRVPQMTKRRATPSLRVYVEETESTVGANQLANVRWSAVFGDVELTAAEFRKGIRFSLQIPAGERLG